MKDICNQMLKGLFHPACFARAVFSLAFVILIFIGHESGDNNGQPRRDRNRAGLDDTNPLSILLSTVFKTLFLPEETKGNAAVFMAKSLAWLQT